MRRSTALAACLVLVSAHRSAFTQDQSRSIKVKTTMNHQAAVELVRIPDGQYHTIGSERLRSLGQQLAPSEEDLERGTVAPLLAIGGPKVVDLQTVRRIPMLIASRRDGQRAWAVDPDQNFTWLITDLYSGVTKPVSPQSLEKRRMLQPEPSGTPPAPSDFDAKVTNYGIERVHLPAVFGPKWPAGRFAVTMISYDWISNTHVFETKPLPEKPALMLQPSAIVQAIPGALTDAVPGNVMSTRNSGAAGEAIVVRVMISMPGDSAPLAKSVDSAIRHSIMPVTLVLQKLDSAVPVPIDLAVPVGIDDGKIVTRFSVNLRDLSGIKDLKGKYQLYLCAGASVVGPQELILP